MKHMIATADGKGMEVDANPQWIAGRQAEEAAWEIEKEKPIEPTEKEIILKALELKTVITEQDKEAAKQALIAEDV